MRLDHDKVDRYAAAYRRLGGYPYDRDPARPGWFATVPNSTWANPKAHPREIFRPAISHSAYALVVVHNHPSGDVSPSEADTRLTRRIAEAAKILQIQLLDHVIVGQPLADRQGYFSFKEAGVIS
jgi:DNA repair protein RadC